LSYSNHSFLPIDYGHAEDTLGHEAVFIFSHFMVHPRGHVADIKNLGKRKEKMTLLDFGEYKAKLCKRKILCHIDPLLDNDDEISGYTTAVAR
jgi:hypothetical protein